VLLRHRFNDGLMLLLRLAFLSFFNENLFGAFINLTKKPMRFIILSTMALLGLCSCASTYQYLTLNAAGMSKNQKKELVWETDTLRLSYNFSNGGAFALTVYNKTDKPLFINFNKSALVRYGHAVSMANPTVQVSGTTTSYGRGGSFGSFNGSFDLPEGVNLIPPASDITKSLNLSVNSDPLSREFLPDSAHIEIGKYADGASYKYQRYTFDTSESPYQFRTYLTFVTGGKEGGEFTVSHTFYTDEVLVTHEPPEFFYAYLLGGDKLYVKQPAQ
jgi:hypothetical protein